MVGEAKTRFLCFFPNGYVSYAQNLEKHVFLKRVTLKTYFDLNFGQNLVLTVLHKIQMFFSFYKPKFI